MNQLDPDCPYHVRLHPDERCTCEPSATHATINVPVRCRRCGWFTGMRPDTCHGDNEHDFEIIRESELTPHQKEMMARAGRADHPANLVAGNRAQAVVDNEQRLVATDEEIEMVRKKLDTVAWTTPLAIWLRKLLARYDADAKRIAELENGWAIEDRSNMALIGQLRERIAELEAELLRLCGPVCEHPPCKGVRASEHAEKFSYVAWKKYLDLKPAGRAVVIDGQPQAHPDWPEGEEWMRAKATPPSPSAGVSLKQED